MSQADPTAFLRMSLRANAVFSGLSGLTFLAASAPIAAWLGGRDSLEIVAVGGALLFFAAFLAWLSSRATIPGSMVVCVIAADLLWVLGTAGVIFADVFSRAGSGVAVVLADAVLLWAVLQSIGLQRMRVAQGLTGPRPLGGTRGPRLALAAWLTLPLLQALAERFLTVPIGPLRMLTIGLCALALVPLGRAALEFVLGTRLSPAARWATALVVPVLAVAHLLAIARFADGPFGPVPGGPFSGAEEAAPAVWSQTGSRRYVELEVDLERPRTIETVFLVHENGLYVAANMPESKRWPSSVRRQQKVRVRFEGKHVYALEARYVESVERTRTLREALNAKYGFDLSLGGPIWFFALEPSLDATPEAGATAEFKEATPDESFRPHAKSRT